uniref:DNA-directed RNA polymerase subunit alpha n=1 Tax=Cyanoptyche gloeocystis TaxID=77922 RepID=A0A3G1IWG1_9EUKA|nr:RNA polymerase alpha subunit [Cyanoptyche gloeocystis]
MIKINNKEYPINQFQFECIECKSENSCDVYGKFILEPLEPGQGITIGNSLRRTLLAELFGYAITSVRIAGINHEFSTIPGVREDVLELLLNLKNIVFKTFTTQAQIGRLFFEGPGVVTASNFELPPEVELVDPRQYLATVCENAVLELEFKIEKGKGYKKLEKQKIDNMSIDFLPVEAIFMPVRKVNYFVEEISINDSQTKDCLILEIWTNGSLSPKEAISQAAEILINIYNPLCGSELHSEIKDITNNPEEKNVKQMPIEVLQLPARAYNCLKTAQIHSIADLLDCSQEDLLDLKNFGQKSVQEVTKALQKKLGINLPKLRILKNKKK